jgi:hypothetical protein
MERKRCAYAIRGVMASGHGILPIGGRLDGACEIPRVGETAAMAVFLGGGARADPRICPTSS